MIYSKRDCQNKMMSSEKGNHVTWSHNFNRELDLGSGCQWDILEYLLLELPPPQDLPLKLRHLQDFPQDILLPILCWTGSVAGIGSHLVCCCRGVRFCLLGESFCVSKVMLSAFIALFVSGFHMVGVLKLMCQPVM